MAHAAELGVSFDTGKMVPTRFHGSFFSAQHGSWNRTTRVGAQVLYTSLKGRRHQRQSRGVRRQLVGQRSGPLPAGGHGGAEGPLAAGQRRRYRRRLPHLLRRTLRTRRCDWHVGLAGAAAVALWLTGAHQALTGDLQAGRWKPQACSMCHGALGVATAPDAPRSGGPAGDVCGCPTACAPQRRAPARGHEGTVVMVVMPKLLGDNDIANLAAWCAAIPLDARAPNCGRVAEMDPAAPLGGLNRRRTGCRGCIPAQGIARVVSISANNGGGLCGQWFARQWLPGTAQNHPHNAAPAMVCVSIHTAP